MSVIGGETGRPVLAFRLRIITGGGSFFSSAEAEEVRNFYLTYGFYGQVDIAEMIGASQAVVARMCRREYAGADLENVSYVTVDPVPYPPRITRWNKGAGVIQY